MNTVNTSLSYRLAEAVRVEAGWLVLDGKAEVLAALIAETLQQYVDQRVEEAKADGRKAAAADIRTRLAEDVAEGNDVSSGAAIQEQHGWREGLRYAADIAEEGLTP